MERRPLASSAWGTRASRSDLKSKVEEPGMSASSAIPFRRGFDALVQKLRATGKLQGGIISRDSLPPSRDQSLEASSSSREFFSRGAGLCFLASPFSNSAKPQTLPQGIERRRIVLLKAGISKIQQNSTKGRGRIVAPVSASLAASRPCEGLPHAPARSALFPGRN